MATVVSQIPDAVVYAQGLAGWAGAKTLTDRLIVNPHGLEPFQCSALADRLRNWPLRVGLKHCFRHARAVISLGGSLTEILSRYVPEPLTRVVTIPNGVEIPIAGYSARAPIADRLRILFVGRFARNKGIPDLLKAISLLEQRGVGDRLQVDLVGSGPLWAELSARAPSRIIRYHGSVADAELQQLYTAADVFVLPTHFEGMPTVVLEAMARGLPIIVSEVGATCELVDSSNGFLIPPSNPLELATRIEQCLRMAPGELQTLGRASFAKATARFSWSEVAQKHVSLFERVSAEIQSSNGRSSKLAG
jgi:glycosyltransferase involved in cell wall biosynthesis